MNLRVELDFDLSYDKAKKLRDKILRLAGVYSVSLPTNNFGLLCYDWSRLDNEEKIEAALEKAGLQVMPLAARQEFIQGALTHRIILCIKAVRCAGVEKFSGLKEAKNAVEAMLQ